MSSFKITSLDFSMPSLRRPLVYRKSRKRGYNPAHDRARLKSSVPSQIRKCIRNYHESVSSVSDDAVYRWTFQRVRNVKCMCMSLYVCVHVCVGYMRVGRVCLGIIRFAWWSSSKAEVEGLPVTERALRSRSSWSVRLSCTRWCSIPRGCPATPFGSACRQNGCSTPSLATGTGKSSWAGNRIFPSLKQKRNCSGAYRW